MPDESILNLKRPGYPKKSEDENAFVTTIEYVGSYSTLEGAIPEIGVAWGEYAGLAKTYSLEPIEGTTYGILTVTVENEFEAAEAGEATGTAGEIKYEVEWVMFQRSLYEHPAFAKGQGGVYALTAQDIVDIQKWQEEQDATLKTAYRYEDTTQDPPYKELSTNAIKFANGIELGQETYEDYSPVIRKTTTYTNGLPSESEAGQKDEPPEIPNKPVGYEWRKSTDRAVTGSEKRKWDRSEEWLGAIKVLSDRDEIFW